LGFDNHPWSWVVWIASRWNLAIPGPIMDICQKGFHHFLQTDYPRPALVFYPTANIYHCFYGYFQSSSRPSHRWNPSIPILHVWYNCLELFFKLSHIYFGNIYSERRPVWKSLLSTYHCSSIHGYLRSVPLRSSTPNVFWVLFLSYLHGKPVH